MKNLDRISGVFFLVLGLAIFAKSMTYPIGSFHAPGGGLFPLLISILLVGLAVVLAIQGFMDKNAGGAKPFFAGKDAPKRILISVAALLGFRYLLSFIGFGVSTFLFIFFQAKYLSHYSWKASLFFSAVTAVAAYYLFQFWLGIPMPQPVLRF